MSWGRSTHSTRATIVERVTAEVLIDTKATGSSAWRWAAREHFASRGEVARRWAAHAHAHRGRRWHAIHRRVGTFATAANSHWWIASLEHVPGVVVATIVVVKVSESIDDAIAQECWWWRWWQEAAAFTKPSRTGWTALVPDARALLRPMTTAAATVARLRIAHA